MLSYRLCFPDAIAVTRKFQKSLTNIFELSSHSENFSSAMEGTESTENWMEKYYSPPKFQY